jgi:hypothetical protein
VRKGTWTARKVAGVVALAVTLGVLAWVRLLAPGALGKSPTGISVSNPITGDLAGVRSSRPGMRVLFVGNSFTYFNDMPGMVEKLARQDPGARPVFAAEYAPPGWRLEWAVRDQPREMALALSST